MDRTLALGVILSLQDRISPALSNVLGRVRNLSQSTSKYQQQIKGLEKQVGGIKGLQKLQRDVGDSGRKMDDARRRVEALGRQMASTATPTATLTRQFEAARRQLNHLQESHTGLTNRANASRQALRDQGIDTRILGDEHQRLRDQIEQTTRQLDDYNAALEQSSQLQSASSTIAKVGTAAAAIGAATGGALKPAVAAYTELEDAGTDLKVSMMKAGGAVSENFEKINALAGKLGNRLPGTTAELQGMMTTLLQQGASEQAILGGLGEASANLGVVLKMPYQDAAEFAAKLQDATGATEDQMMGLMDVIQRTFYLGTDSGNMLAGMTKLSPAMDILKRKGLDVVNTFAPLLVMADQAGMQGEAAGNAYRKIFQAAMNADDKVTKVNKALKADGHKIKLDFTNGKGEFGGMDKLFAELDKLKALNTQDKLGAIKGIFGDDAETLQAVALLIDKGADGYAEVQQKMAAQADIQARVNAVLGTLNNLWGAVTGTFTNISAAFIQPISGDLKDLIVWLAKVQEKTVAWMEQHPVMVRYLALTTFGVAALATVLGGLLIGVAAMISTWAWAVAKWATLAPMLASIRAGVVRLWGALRAFALANPMLAALALLAFAAYMVYANWDEICSGLKLIWQQLSDNADSFWQSITSSFPRAVAAFTLVTMALRAMAMAAFANPIVAIVAVLAGAAYLIWNNWDWLKQKFSQFWSWLSQSARELWQKVTTAFAAGWSGLTMWFNSIVTRFSNIGGNLVDGLINGIRSRWEGLKATIMELAQSLPDPVKKALDIHSPSRVFVQLGGYVTDGLTLGLQDGAADTLNEIQRISRMIAQTDIVMPGSSYPGFNAQTVGTLSELQRLSQLTVQPDIVMSGKNAEPIMDKPAGAKSEQSLMQSVSITINAAPGMDPAQIATEVQRQLAMAQRKAKSAARSNLYDEF